MNINASNQSGSSSTPAQPNLSQYLVHRYAPAKRTYPGEGRRRWRLRVAAEFWDLSSADKAAYRTTPVYGDGQDEQPFTTDNDPCDAISTDAPGLGVLVRTDYSDENAWRAFSAKLQEAEAEYVIEIAVEPKSEDNSMDTDDLAGEAEATDGAVPGEDDDDEDSDEHTPIFHVIDAPPHNRPQFAQISNLTALRMLNDVDIRLAPIPPAGTARIKPPNRLVDHDGWQEVYTGKTVWIYDTKSNTDQCVRLVSQQSAMYGTATADSWRARVSHICELQVNLACGAITINFGAIDRYDYEERIRNMEEAVRPIS